VRLALIAALVLAGACGGRSPMSPSTTTGPLPTMSLDPGPYLLTVAMSTSGQSGISSCVSMTIGGSPPAFAAVFVPTPVHLERAGNDVTIAPDDPSATFRMQLQIAGANLSGKAAGQYRSSATTITVSGPTSGTAAAATGTLGQASASGVLDGVVSVDAITCMNNGHGWTLAPR